MTNLKKKKLMHYLLMKPFIAACFAVPIITGCGDKAAAEVERPVPQKLAPVSNVSLDSNPSSQTVTLSRDVESEGAILSLRDNSSWIKRLSLKGNLVTFDVEENPNRVTGHRFDTIVVSVGDARIGTICVSQARNRKAAEKLQWANSDAIYKDKSLPDGLETGKELTMFIYNLEKTTGGADSYKNYPAFAYCIEMNHDPAKDMEWHLGARSEVEDMRGEEYADFSGYHWNASDVRGTYADVFGYRVGTLVREKSERNRVYAFRNGKMD